jgi:hypothetical protein
MPDYVVQGIRAIKVIKSKGHHGQKLTLHKNENPADSDIFDVEFSYKTIKSTL